MHTDSYESAFVTMMMALAIIMVLLFLTLWLMRRFSKARFFAKNQGCTIKILERRPLSPKSMLYLVEVDGKRTLIAESHLEVRRLATFQEGEEEGK